MLCLPFPLVPFRELNPRPKSFESTKYRNAKILLPLAPKSRHDHRPTKPGDTKVGKRKTSFVGVIFQEKEKGKREREKVDIHLTNIQQLAYSDYYYIDRQYNGRGTNVFFTGTISFLVLCPCRLWWYTGSGGHRSDCCSGRYKQANRFVVSTLVVDVVEIAL